MSEYQNNISYDLYESKAGREREEAAKQKLRFLVTNGRYPGLQDTISGALNLPFTTQLSRLFNILENLMFYLGAPPERYIGNIARPVVVEQQHQREDGEMQVESYELAKNAKLRNISITRPQVTALKSMYNKHPIVPTIINNEFAAASRRYKAERDLWVQKSRERAEQVQIAVATQKKLAALESALLEQQAGQAQQSQQMEMMAALEQRKQQLLLVMAHLEEQGKDTQSLIREVAVEMKRTYRDIKVKALEDALFCFIANSNIRDEREKAFEHHLLFGEPIYNVDVNPNDIVDPIFRAVDPRNVYYDLDESCRYLHEVSWLVEYKMMSFHNVLAQHTLTAEDVDTLRGFQFSATGRYPFLPLFLMGQITNEQKQGVLDPLLTLFQMQTFGAPTMPSTFIDVHKVYWKEQVPTFFIYEEDKNRNRNAVPFPTLVDIVPKDEMTSEMRESFKKKGLQVIQKSREEVWSGALIGNPHASHIYNAVGIHPVQQRSPNNLHQVHLPYVGFAKHFSNFDQSLIYLTRDLQVLYNICTFQEEMLIVMAGTKGIIYDISQKPDQFTFDEILHHRRQGMMLIQSVQSDGIPRQFNQFQTYDDTLSATIQNLQNTKEYIRQQVQRLTGVNDQQLGQMSPTDAVGTTEMALQQANIVVDAYFQTSDRIFELALTKLANLFTHAYKSKPLHRQYVWDNETRNVVLKAEELDGDYKVVVRNGAEERASIESLRQAAQAQLKAGNAMLSEYVKVWDAKTMSQLRAIVEESEALMQERQRQQQENQQAMEEQFEQKRMQLLQQQQAMMGQMNQQLEQVRTQGNLQVEQLKQQGKQVELQMKQQQAAAAEETKRMGITVDAQVELGYAELQAKELEQRERLEMIRLELQQLTTKMEKGGFKTPTKNRIKD